MSDGKVFLDANVLVYAHDASAGKKHEIARATMDELWSLGSGVLSSQVLQEWFVTVTRKIPKPLDVASARGIVEALLTWEVVANDGASVLAAVELHQRLKFSFWDSLILQAALRAGASRLLSEDLGHGQEVEGLRIENPFLGVPSANE
jgi:predicted nucleic acid-binding protein